jgi:hypothetical protein
LDILYGGGGEDFLFPGNNPAGRDVVYCGPGRDLVDAEKKTSSTTASVCVEGKAAEVLGFPAENFWRGRALSRPGSSICLYSPECVEGEFSEVVAPASQLNYPRYNRFGGERAGKEKSCDEWRLCWRLWL